MCIPVLLDDEHEIVVGHEARHARVERKSAHAQPEEKRPYTPRPKSQIVLAWVLLAVVLFAIGGMCYWQMFGRF